VDTWWYVSEGERKGPASELRRLLLDGKLTPASLVWKSGLDTWCPVEKLDELAPILGPLPPEIPSSQIAAGQPRWRALGIHNRARIWRIGFDRRYQCNYDE
jgi:GYF domain 2